MRRLLGATVLAAALLPVAGAGATTTSAARANMDYAHDAVTATNHVRMANDRKALYHSTCLAHLAWTQAHRMANRHEIFHQDMGNALRVCHLSYAGENVADGYATGRSVVYDGWLHSPPHRANLLSRHYTRLAIGAVRSGDGKWYVSQVFGRPA